MQTRIDILCQFILVWPFGKSLHVVSEMANALRMNVLSSSTSSPLVKIAVPWQTFKRAFGSGANPRVGSYSVPIKLQQYVTKIEVIGTRVVHVKKN